MKQLDMFGGEKQLRKSPAFFSEHHLQDDADEEHLFRRWQSGEMCADLGPEHGMTEMQMINRIARIWRRLGRQ